MSQREEPVAVQTCQLQFKLASIEKNEGKIGPSNEAGNGTHRNPILRSIPLQLCSPLSMSNQEEERNATPASPETPPQKTFAGCDAGTSTSCAVLASEDGGIVETTLGAERTQRWSARNKASWLLLICFDALFE